jgi:hypothetical protein
MPNSLDSHIKFVYIHTPRLDTMDGFIAMKRSITIDLKGDAQHSSITTSEQDVIQNLATQNFISLQSFFKPVPLSFAESDDIQLINKSSLLDGVESVHDNFFPGLQWRHLPVIGDGNCYWRALAVHFFGEETYWPHVKAGHLVWFYHVLQTPTHYRHRLYKMLDKVAANLNHQAISLSKSLIKKSAWTNSAILQVSADYFDCCLIVFRQERVQNGKEKIVGHYSRGFFNATQKFLLINNNHWTPLTQSQSNPLVWASECHATLAPLSHSMRRDGWDKSFDDEHEKDWNIVDRILPPPAIYIPLSVTQEVLEMVTDTLVHELPQNYVHVKLPSKYIPDYNCSDNPVYGLDNSSIVLCSPQGNTQLRPPSQLQELPLCKFYSQTV